MFYRVITVEFSLHNNKIYNNKYKVIYINEIYINKLCNIIK